MSVEEEAQPRRERVHVETRRNRCFDVGDRVSKCKREFLDGGRAGLADVIAADRNGVPRGQLGAGPFENVGDDAHRRPRRIDIGPARDIFFQYVVLNRPR